MIRSPAINFVVKIPELTQQMDARLMAVSSPRVSPAFSLDLDVKIDFEEVVYHSHLEQFIERGWDYQLSIPVIRTLMDNGPTAGRYDVVILGDGYTTAEEEDFFADAEQWIEHHFSGVEPYATYAQSFNVHAVFRASNESGADRPDENPPVTRDTYTTPPTTTAEPIDASTPGT